MLRWSRAAFCSNFFPIIMVEFWRSGTLADGMPMPEADVDENDATVLGEDDVRRSRQTFAVHSEAVTHVNPK